MDINDFYYARCIANGHCLIISPKREVALALVHLEASIYTKGGALLALGALPAKDLLICIRKLQFCCAHTKES